MIHAITCPNCDHISAVAEDVSVHAVLRCRHCGCQVVFGELVDQELDTWEVIDDPGALVATGPLVDSEQPQEMEAAEYSPGLELVREESAEGPEEPEGLYEEPEELSEEVYQESFAAPQQVPPAPAKQRVDWSKFDTISQEYTRARKKTRSPIWSILSVASGGLAAIPIATLLIWHLLGKDPLEFGPTVAKYVPWVVPARFRPYENHNDSRRNAWTAPKSTPQRGASGFRQFNEITPASDLPKPDVSASDMAGINELSTNKRLEASDLPVIEPTLAEIEKLQSSSDAAPVAQELPNVFSLIRRVEDDLAAWRIGNDQLEREAKKKLAQQLYGDLSELALKIDEQPTPNAVMRLINDELNDVGNAVKEQASVQSLIQAGSRFWIANHQNDIKVGLAIVGEVTQATAENGEWLLLISPEIGGSLPLRVVVPGLLNSSLEPGQRLLMLGTAAREFAEPTSELPESAPRRITFVANYLYAL